MKITNSIKEYIEKNALRKNIICKFSDGKLLHFHNGKWINEDDFEKKYPKYDYKPFNWKGENPDTTSLA